MPSTTSARRGYVPIDPHSLQMAPELDWQWYDDKAFMNRLGSTLSPGQVKADSYCAIYYAGGHGVVWDLPDNAPLQELARRIYEAGGWWLRCAMAWSACSTSSSVTTACWSGATGHRVLQHRGETRRVGQGRSVPDGKRTGRPWRQIQQARGPLGCLRRQRRPADHRAESGLEPAGSATGAGATEKPA